MKILLVSNDSSPHLTARHGLGRCLSALSVVTVLCAASTSLVAQEPAAGAADAQGGRRRNTAQTDNGGDRRNLSPEDMQARMMTQMRERFEVTDDEEWKLISARLTKVMELRRTAGGGGGPGGFGGRGPQGGGGGGGGGGNTTDARGRGGRGGTGGSAEVIALSSALRDKLPDAEIKSRLDRVRDVRKENEAKLVKAQEELRAVLSVRQEAQAVVFGMLP